LRDIAKERDHTEHGHTHVPTEGGCCAWSMAAGLGYEVCTRSGRAAYILQELDALVKQPRPLRFTIHMRQILQPTDYEAEQWQMDADERLSSVPQLRIKGNAEYARGEWRAAAACYTDALNRCARKMC
jgi:hypothetical protein